MLITARVYDGVQLLGWQVSDDASDIQNLSTRQLQLPKIHVQPWRSAFIELDVPRNILLQGQHCKGIL